MDFGFNIIKDYCRKNSIRISIIYQKKFSPCFSQRKFLGFKQKIKDISESEKIKHENIFGFRDSQSLVSFDSNTPNNTLGLFFENHSRFCLFPRFPKKKLIDKSTKNDFKNLKQKISHHKIDVEITKDEFLVLRNFMSKKNVTSLEIFICITDIPVNRVCEGFKSLLEKRMILKKDGFYFLDKKIEDLFNIE